MRFIAEIQQSDGYNSVIRNVRTDSFEMLRQTVLAVVWEGPSTEDLVPLEGDFLVIVSTEFVTRAPPHRKNPEYWRQRQRVKQL
jgi:hypothetical protein